MTPPPDGPASRITVSAGRGGPLGRRAFLAGALAAAAAASCSDGGSGSDGGDGVGDGGDAAEDTASVRLPPLPDDLPEALFALGVASGDPLPDAVVLWTRLVADTLASDGALPAAPVPVHWEVATDEGFADVVADGDAVAEPAAAHAVHVDASGLSPATWYWYRFRVGERTSPVGRTRTAPAADADPARLRFGVASCQNRQDGFWAAHEHLAAEDVDVVVFLGDYIYEEAPLAGAVRPGETPEPTDLAGYRARWGEYKRDPLLQAAHARAPWICTWDDHEVANNYAGEMPAGEEPPAAFRDRRAAAYRAWYEHLPVRVDPPGDVDDRGDGAGLTVHRQVGWGTLARFLVLDTRQHRSDQACDRPLDIGESCDGVDGAGRTLLGTAQEEWLGEALAAGDATWNLVAQQVIMSRLAIPLGEVELLNLDQWDGYPVARRRLVEQLRGASNPVVLTGDVHASLVGVVTADPDDPDSAPAVPELVGTSISSAFPPNFVGPVEAAAALAPAIRYLDARSRGYVVCEVTPGELRAEFRTVSTTAQETAAVTTSATWLVRAGDPEPRPV